MKEKIGKNASQVVAGRKGRDWEEGSSMLAVGCARYVSNATPLLTGLLPSPPLSPPPTAAFAAAAAAVDVYWCCCSAAPVCVSFSCSHSWPKIKVTLMAPGEAMQWGQPGAG